MFNSLFEFCNKDQKIQEGIVSKKLAQLVSASKDQELLKKLFKRTNIQLDKLSDDQIKYADISAAKAKMDPKAEDWVKSNVTYTALRAAEIYPNDGLIFWVSKTDKKLPSGTILKAGLIGVSDEGHVATDAFGTPTRGMKHMDRLREYADEVYAMDPYRIKRSSGGYGDRPENPGLGADKIQQQRRSEKEGALALIDPAEIAKWNQRRYKRIVAERNPSPEITALANELNDLTAKAIAGINANKMEGGKARVPGIVGRDDKPITVRTFLSQIDDAWDNLQSAQARNAEMKREPDYKEGEDNYYTRSMKQYIEKAEDVIATLKSGKIDRWSRD